MIKALFTAFHTLTIIPLPGNGKERFASSLLFFPAAGAMLGLAAICAQIAVRRLSEVETSVWAILSLGIVTWLTGCIHVDGVGDAADAFGAGRSRERVLEILKDSRHGTYGVCAIYFDLAIKAVLWNLMLEDGGACIILSSLVLSRCMQAAALAFMPSARAGSTAEAFASPGARISACAGFAVTCVFLFLYIGLLRWIVLSGLALMSFAILMLYFFKRIGGITGDCVGVVNECAEIAVLLGGTAIMNS